MKITNQPSSSPLFDVDPSWMPLSRAPFLYRTCSGEDWCEGWENGTSDQQLELWLQPAGVREAIVDRLNGEFRLTLPEGATGPFNFPICCHPAEFDPADIRDEHLRSTVSAQVLFAWSRMQDEFRRAVAERRCIIFARAGSMLNSFTLIAPDVFRHFRIIDWRNGEAVNAIGEKLFSIHVAPPQFGSPTQLQRRLQPGSVPEKICTYLQLRHPDGKPDDMSYDAIAAAFRSDTRLNVSEAWVRQTAQEYLGWPKRAKKSASTVDP